MTSIIETTASLAVEPCEAAFIGLRFSNGAVRATEVENPVILWATIVTAKDGPPQVIATHGTEEEAMAHAKEIMEQSGGKDWIPAPKGRPS